MKRNFITKVFSVFLSLIVSANTATAIGYVSGVDYLPEHVARNPNWNEESDKPVTIPLWCLEDNLSEGAEAACSDSNIILGIMSVEKYRFRFIFAEMDDQSSLNIRRKEVIEQLERDCPGAELFCMHNHLIGLRYQEYAKIDLEISDFIEHYRHKPKPSWPQPYYCKYENLLKVAEFIICRDRERSEKALELFNLTAKHFPDELYRNVLTNLAESRILYCYINEKCIDKYLDYFLQETRRRIAPKIGNCLKGDYDKQIRNCGIVFSAEFGCSGSLSGELGELSGRSAASSAICSVAMQELLTGNIDWVAAGISVSAGLADDIAENLFEQDDIGSKLLGGLFQLGSYGAMGAGVAWCYSEVERQCTN